MLPLHPIKRVLLPSLIASAVAFGPLTGCLSAAPALEGWHDDLTKAVEEARKQDAMILVDLYADWCGWCKVLEEKVFSSEPFLKYIDEQKFVLLRVDTEDGAEGTQLQARYHASSLPTTLILDKDLVKVGAISGYAPTATFVRYIDEQISAWGVLLANYELVLKEGDPNLQRDLAKDFHSRGDGGRAAALYDQVLERVQKGTSASAWIHYLSADAHRLGGNFDEARHKLAATKKLAEKLDDEPELQEKADLLSFYIAQDSGDCRQAVDSLESFLTSHPTSFLNRELQRTLKTLKSSDDPACA